MTQCPTGLVVVIRGAVEFEGMQARDRRQEPGKSAIALCAPRLWGALVTGIGLEVDGSELGTESINARVKQRAGKQHT